MLKQLFDAEKILRGLYGSIGGAFGSQGQRFGYQGGKYGEEGSSNLPKYDPTDYFKAESYFDAKRLFDPDKLANQILSDAVGRVSRG
jgi:hypothetical protein